ncbi:homeobox protein knotted-1-like 1 isoform X2 [Cajanus cajan]|uniref:Homeobox protein knotted-1-like 1 n=1 Tax=Cajanus cajan TaxID=3821 RepID=A0A151REB8_CAJCA|nr:homeobox protein knotted-1-like 1 isoform X2 [Cajanus cajan]KYP40837.1 Homeobox protein knotted-1-like 1 [Cajanus cajan]
MHATLSLSLPNPGASQSHSPHLLHPPPYIVHSFCSKIDHMESHTPNTNDTIEIEAYKQQQLEEEDDDEEENNEILKRRISNHPLYGLLVEAHLDCLKVGDISNLERELKIDEMQAREKQNMGMFSQSELDLFMEAYCLALGKLKEAMVEPQQKSMAFINNMHSQLRELTKATLPAPPEPAASSSECKLIRRNPTI